jgi:hypothetical protein
MTTQMIIRVDPKLEAKVTHRGKAVGKRISEEVSL